MSNASTFRLIIEDNQLLVDSDFSVSRLPLVEISENGNAIPLRSLQQTPSGFRLWYQDNQQILITLQKDPRDANLFAAELALEGLARTVKVEFPALTSLTFPDQTAIRHLVTPGETPDSPRYGSTLSTRMDLITAGGKYLVWMARPVRQASEASDSRAALTILVSQGQGGWREGFNKLKNLFRAGIDLREYQRPDTAWYKDQFVQHFTFLYGKEILNLSTGEFEVERFLDEAEKDFGGYDGFLIWGVYPRIGIDERSQWDFYDDFPGGRKGLRAMSDAAHKRGVKFFVPYKPWDQSRKIHGLEVTPDAQELARLIVDCDADGVFLDTMDFVNPEFRREIDSRRPGVVFCSEGRAGLDALEIVTGSWDQSPHRGHGEGNWCASVENPLKLDIARFLLPEHKLFVINRHSMDKDRLNIIRRGFWNGTGWVVWQDIFGLTLPFTRAETDLLRKCRSLLREHRAAINSSSVTPLLPTDTQEVWVNEFAGEEMRVWTIMAPRATSHPATIAAQLRLGCHLVDVWNRKMLPGVPGEAIRVPGFEGISGAIVEYPSLLEYDRQTDTAKLKSGAENVKVLWNSGRQTLPCAVIQQKVVIPASSCLDGWLQAVKGDEILDQIEINRREPANEA